jgi:gamma-glutamylcyclotransferase (GGCT)/AIG2-like uncharacterized protein YtfP
LSELLFVYGTLRSDAGGPMARALGEKAKLLGRASFRGRLYDLGAYPVVVPSDDPGDVVRGEAWLLPEAAATLAALDRYEGCSPEDPEPHEYRRARATVVGEDGRPLEAWIYLSAVPVDGLPRIVSGDWLVR